MRVLSALILLVFACLAQNQPKPSFEVADIKPSDPSIPGPGKGRVLPGGRIELPSATVKNLIVFAYGVQEDMIVGGPKWLDTDRFDLVAKAPPDVNSPEVLRPMMQSLLAERFQLAFHREDKPMSAYVLTLGKRALKLQQGSGTQQQCMWRMLDSGLRQRECHNMTMDELARQLPGWGGIGIDRPVVNETGLKGPYDFQLDVGFPGGREPGRGEERPAAIISDSGPTIFTAFDQVGLKLESRKMPLPVIVIDRVEKPM